jgi:ribosomal protein S18 acetylase RimI-like enzyme
MIREIDTNDFTAFIECIDAFGEDARLDEANRIDKEHLLQCVKEGLINPNNKVFVKVMDNKIVGFIAGQIQQRFWNKTVFGEIIFLYIHSAVRNKRIADEFYQHITEWFEDMGCEYMLTSVCHWNKDYEPEEEWMRKAKTYYEFKKMKPVGYYYIKELDHGQE